MVTTFITLRPLITFVGPRVAPPPSTHHIYTCDMKYRDRILIGWHIWCRMRGPSSITIIHYQQLMNWYISTTLRGYILLMVVSRIQKDETVILITTNYNTKYYIKFSLYKSHINQWLTQLNVMVVVNCTHHWTTCGQVFTSILITYLCFYGYIYVDCYDDIEYVEDIDEIEIIHRKGIYRCTSWKTYMHIEMKYIHMVKL